MKVAVVTGATGGIGSEICRVLAKNGYSIAALYNKSADKAANLKAELETLGCDCEVYSVPVENKVFVKNTFDEILRRFKHIDLLVNNAGIAQSKLFCDITEDDFDRMVDVNLKGVFNCSQSALCDMLKRQCGNIINISSMWGQVGASCEVHYSAAKAGVIGMTKALAKEVSPSGIRVNCVAPGVIDTEMLSSYSKEDLDNLAQETPLLRIGTPTDVANAVLFLASDASSFITGEVIGVNGGFII